MSTTDIEQMLSDDDWLHRIARSLVHDLNTAEDLKIVWVTRSPTAEFDALPSYDGKVERAAVDGRLASFRAEGLDDGTYIALASTAGARAGHVGVRVREGESDPCEIVVDPEVAQHVSLRWQYDGDRVGPTDRIAPPDVVEASSASGEHDVITPDRRRVAWIHPEHGPITVRVSDPRFREVRIPPLPPGTDHVVRLRGNASIELDVRAPDGSSVALYSVAAKAEFARDHFVVHDGLLPLEDGRLERLIPGSYDLRILADGRLCDLRVPDLQPNESRRVEALLEPATRMIGTAIDSAGRPLVGAPVSAVRPAAERDRDAMFVIPITGFASGPGARKQIAESHVGADGTFEILLPNAGAAYALLDLASSRHWLGPFDVDDGETVHADFELPARASLAGQVVLPGHLEPRDFEVLLWRDVFTKKRERMRLDSTARFRASDLPSGDFDLFLIRTGVQGVATQSGPAAGERLGAVTLRPGEHTEVDLVHPGAKWSEISLRCEVAGVQSHPVQVAVQESPGRSLAFNSADAESVTDGVAGPLVLEAGRHRLWVEGSDWTSGSAVEFDVHAGTEEWMDIEIDLVESDVVVELDGEIARNRTLKARLPNGFRVEWTLVCDENGSATVTLPRGRSFLHLVKDENRNASVHRIEWSPAGGVLRLD